MSASTVTVYAWELHMTAGGSDKYYRLLLVDHVLLVNYGRRNTFGQFYAHVKPTAESAKQVARDLTNQKAAKGYHLTRDMTAFEVPELDARSFTSLASGKHNIPDSPTCDAIVKAFKAAATQQATATGEASW